MGSLKACKNQGKASNKLSFSASQRHVKRWQTQKACKNQGKANNKLLFSGSVWESLMEAWGGRRDGKKVLLRIWDRFISFRCLYSSPTVSSIISWKTIFPPWFPQWQKNYMNVKKMYKACSLVQFVHCKKNLKALPYFLGIQRFLCFLSSAVQELVNNRADELNSYWNFLFVSVF